MMTFSASVKLNSNGRAFPGLSSDTILVDIHFFSKLGDLTLMTHQLCRNSLAEELHHFFYFKSNYLKMMTLSV